MKFKLAFQSLVLAAGAINAQITSVEPHAPRMSYIENGDIRLGVDLNLGGAITYLAPATNRLSAATAPLR